MDLKKAAAALERNRYAVRLFGTAAEAADYLEETIRGTTVGFGDSETLDALAANVSANFLGLGNAATPMGIKAAQGMARLSERPGTAGKELCLLVVLNTASIQLLPTTAAALRASYGSASPFDILPAVWISSALSVTAGLCAAALLARLCGE